MADINQLSSTSTPAIGDLLALWSNQNGDTRKVTLANILALFQPLITAADDKVTQYAAPSAPGFTVTLTDNSDSKWLVMTPAGTIASGTLVLPAVANCTDRQEILVNSTQAVNALTINGNGATVTGAPTALTANAFFRLRFDAVADVWYRIS